MCILPGVFLYLKSTSGSCGGWCRLWGICFYLRTLEKTAAVMSPSERKAIWDWLPYISGRSLTIHLSSSVPPTLLSLSSALQGKAHCLKMTTAVQSLPSGGKISFIKTYFKKKKIKKEYLHYSMPFSCKPMSEAMSNHLNFWLSHRLLQNLFLMHCEILFLMLVFSSVVAEDRRGDTSW